MEFPIFLPLYVALLPLGAISEFVCSINLLLASYFKVIRLLPSSILVKSLFLYLDVFTSCPFLSNKISSYSMFDRCFITIFSIKLLFLSYSVMDFSFPFSYSKTRRVLSESVNISDIFYCYCILKHIFHYSFY